MRPGYPLVTPLQFTLLTFGISLFAGLLGSLLGLGGGILVIPALTLLGRSINKKLENGFLPAHPDPARGR